MADPIKLRSEDVAHIRDWIQKQPHLPSGIPGAQQNTNYIRTVFSSILFHQFIYITVLIKFDALILHLIYMNVASHCIRMKT